jgi:hypothetical protein
LKIISKLFNLKNIKYLKNYLQNNVANRDVILIGSAPNFDGEFKYDDSKILVTVNGSSLVIKNNLIPDLCVFNTSILGTGNAGEETSEYLNRISAKHLLIVEGHPNYSENWTRILSEVNFESFDFYSFERRVSLLERVFESNKLKNSEVLSTGFFALLLLLTSKASSVNLYGFSLINGHSYLNNVYKRDHKDADRRLLELIRGRFKIYGEIVTDGSPIKLS